MLILLAFIIVFHITSAALLFIATIDSAWWVADGFYTDVWYRCSNVSNCTALDETFPDFSAFRAIQTTMVLSTILCCVAFFVFIFQLFRLKQGERFILTSIIQLLSCLCVMIAVSVYTDRQEELHKGPQKFLTVITGQFGYSYVLAWVAFAFTLLSGIMYLILRKRK